jgi:hypothetical protein
MNNLILILASIASALFVYIYINSIDTLFASDTFLMYPILNDDYLDYLELILDENFKVEHENILNFITQNK